MTTALTPEEEARYAELQCMALDFARQGETEELEKMIRAGLPVNLSDHKGNTLLMMAAYYDQADTVKMLLRYGADVDRRNDRGQTPLGGVSFKGYTRIAEILLEHGADPNADNGGGSTPLTYATMFGRLEVADLLIRKGGRHGAKKWQQWLGKSADSFYRLFKKSAG